MGSAGTDDKPTPMSDPMSRKSPSKHENNVLLDFLAPATTASMVSSSSAPNLAKLDSTPETKAPGLWHSFSCDLLFIVCDFILFGAPAIHIFNNCDNHNPKSGVKSVRVLSLPSAGQTVSSSSDDFSSSFSAAPAPAPSKPPAAPSPGHKRNQSINLMDIKSDADDLIDSFDMLGRPANSGATQEPKPSVNVCFASHVSIVKLFYLSCLKSNTTFQS